VILDLQRFQAQAQPRWDKLEALLALLEGRPDRLLKPGEAEQLQEHYAQTAADLNRVIHGALAPDLRQYLERLVARAYAELTTLDLHARNFGNLAAGCGFSRRFRKPSGGNPIISRSPC